MKTQAGKEIVVAEKAGDHKWRDMSETVPRKKVYGQDRVKQCKEPKG